MNARSRAFWTFQLLFWLIAGTALLISGATQMPFDEALIRNAFLTVAGGVLHPIACGQWNVDTGKKLAWLEIHAIEVDDEASEATFAKPAE